MNGLSYWGSLLLRTFIIEKWVEFSLTSFGTLEYDCVNKTIEPFDFLNLINNSVTTGFIFCD